MPLLGAGWLSGYAITILIGRSGKLKWPKACATPMAAKMLPLSTSRASDATAGNKKAMTDVSFKPPNILIYSGSRDTDNRIFNCIKETLLQVLNLHSYAIYQLDEQQVNTEPWMENTSLLVFGNHDSTSPQMQKQFVKYLRGGGRVLSLCSSVPFHSVKHPWEDRFKPFVTSVEVSHLGQFQNPAQSVGVICDPFYFKGEDHTVLVKEVKTKKPVIIQIKEGDGSAVFSLVHLELMSDEQNIGQNQEFDDQSANGLRQSNDARMWILSRILQQLGISCQACSSPELTPLYLLAGKLDEHRLLQSLRSGFKNGVCEGKDLSLHFVPSGKPIPKTTKTLLPVITGVQNNPSVSFDWKKYLESLQTKAFGHIMLYTEVITSTQAVLDGNYTFVQKIPDDLGIIIVAGQQLQGQGRGGNVWLSPAGCMMFSLHVQIPFATNLGQRPPFLQHIASLAAVEAIRSQPGYEGIDVSLKWPNDIYFGHKIKIGGVIVTSSAVGGNLSALIGMGVNVANSEPTISINEIISQYNKDHKTNLQPLTIEETLARTVNSIEAFVDDFQNNGVNSFLEKYYNRWLHSNAKVKLSMNDAVEDVMITGLDQFGFLLVQTNSGQILSVQPDGNSFDMLKNLIVIRK